MTKETSVEMFRPAMHFSPAKHWINDPNGLVYYKGEYHLFYQYHPHSTIWGPMHWGHAVSKDLALWEELPIALYPDELGAIFSGSAVVDWNNTSGLQTGEEAVMVAIFTHHGEDNEKQSIAYSNDRGRTWVKYEGNPVLLNPDLKDFRDPKVFWHEETSKWIMSLACGDHIRFYASPNLKDWEYLSSFGETFGNHGGVWECPDLIHLKVEGEQAKKWVLIVSVNPGGPNGGSAIQYFTGDFDGTTFVTDQCESEEKWADWGRDFYAAVTWSGTEQPIWIGWMNNWQYANQTPTAEFRGSMSIPRSLSLENKEGLYTLIQKPILSDKMESDTIFNRQDGSFKNLTVKVPEQPFMVDMKLNSLSSFALSLKGEGGQLDIEFDGVSQELRVDRTKSGMIGFSEHFASLDTMPLESFEDVLLLVDKASVELFVNGGRSVMTESFYLAGSIEALEFKSFLKEPVEYKQIRIQSISL
ncbi:glycoside hydrolase family 32 protein [Metabacillus litoralis]|jgi:fructan beta-fructosidase|uniref:glycoside hydrolase family 32 protein n=1 Tax=Metabacillus litoralis TaxID=152268 RepID=UPI002040AD1A|nr:glycoside hydrolase family 32 protein [Metabacillus litoralis]MCM3652893.1 glycoside hydrolase family 32 protein [Metabacillus litoralis]